VYNIKKAVSRLDFAPKIDEIKITEIKRGLGAFAPKPDKPVSFAALKATLKKAGYTLASAEITVVGTLARDDAGLRIEADLSNQQFAIEGDNVKQILGGADAGARGSREVRDQDLPVVRAVRLGAGAGEDSPVEAGGLIPGAGCGEWAPADCGIDSVLANAL